MLFEHLNQPQTAATLFGATSSQGSTVLVLALDAVVERLQSALGETELKRCVSVGALMDPADVVRYARRSINLANTQPGSSTAIGSGSGHC